MDRSLKGLSADDIAFIDQLIETLQKEGGAKPGRVVVVGHSL